MPLLVLPQSLLYSGTLLHGSLSLPASVLNLPGLRLAVYGSISYHTRTVPSVASDGSNRVRCLHAIGENIRDFVLVKRDTMVEVDTFLNSMLSC